jgi:YD repeat-containing protein
MTCVALAFVGVLAGLAIAYPSRALARRPGRIPWTVPAPTAAAKRVKVVRELTKLRTASSDTFLLADGSREVVVYDHPVNYRTASGAWQPLNETLRESAGGSFQPTSSPLALSLPSSLAGGRVSVGQGPDALSFALAGASAGSARDAGARRSFAGVMPGVEAAYTATANGVREVLTLASASAPTRYTYTLSYASDLHPRLSPVGSVVFTNNAGSVVYTLATPTVQDSSRSGQLPATAVQYTLGDGGHALTLVLSKAWFDSPSRVFPVKVDPDVYYGADEDCTIASGSYANTSLCGGRLYVGRGGGGSVSRTLLRYDLEGIPRDAQVLSSSIALGFEAEQESETPLEIEVEALTRNFTSLATWNSFNGAEPWSTAGGDYQTPFAGRQTIYPEWREGWVSWGFSPLVEHWIQDPGANHGLLLKVHDESATGYDVFTQTDNCEELPEPDIQIIYEPRLGDQEGDMVSGAELAGGAEAAVNVTNGNLLLSSPDVDYAGEGYETRLDRYYNSQDDDLVGSSFGPGWTLGMGNDTLVYPSWWDRSESFHEPSGSWGRFDPTPPAQASEDSSDQTYTSPAGQEVTLKVNEGGTRTLTYPATETEWNFDASENGFPQSIVENEGVGNTIHLEYDSSQLSHLEDSHGDVLEIPRVYAEGHVNKIEGSGAKHWSYGYNASDELSSYESPEGENTTYDYNGEDMLDEIQDPSGTYVIEYDGLEPARVTSIRRLVNGTVSTVGSEDEITSFEYTGPQSPTCNPETDSGETTVRFSPGEQAPETYCYDAAGEITNWVGPEPEPETESSEGFEEQEEVAEGACYSSEEFPAEDCGQEDAPPENEEAEGGEADFETALTPSIPDLGPTHYGIADNSGLDIFSDRYFKELHVVNVRRSIPWDLVPEAESGDSAAKAELEEVETWASDVKALSKNTGQPLVTFERCPGVHEEWVNPLDPSGARISCNTAPSVAEYEAAVKAFFTQSTLKEVKYFTPWDEPNRCGGSEPEPTCTNGELAGKYWRVLDRLCSPHEHNCQVAAGDFLDTQMHEANNAKSPGGRYFKAYYKGMGHPTTGYRWAWHAYSDGEEVWRKYRDRSPEDWWKYFKNFHDAIDRLVKKYVPDIWLSEQGVVFSEDGVNHPAATSGAHAQDIMRAYVDDGTHQLTRQSRQITRFYYYEMKGTPKAKGNFDSGLLFPSGAPRPRKIYYIYREKTPRS